MAAYYNENDQKTAAWLRELIKSKLIADGEVDERSIEDVRPVDLRGFTQHHFFAGIGGWSYALKQAGIEDETPIWTACCPCQPFSAGGKRKGFADERHLWPAFFHLARSERPRTIIGEQVASKDGLAWLDVASGKTQNGTCAVMGAGGQLNPALPRWLMAFPPEWCDCAVTAMQSISKSPKNSSKHVKRKD